MFSLTSEYVLRAAIFLARHVGEGPIPGRRIAEQEGIPQKYLAKILGDLVRTGCLESFPGKAGGFRLRQPSEKMTLFELLTPFGHFEPAECPFQDRAGEPATSGPAFQKWTRMMEARRRFLQEVSLHDAAFGGPPKRQPSAAKKAKPPSREAPDGASG